MITSSHLRNAREFIAGRFIAQCSMGPQLNGLTDKAACGQFLDDTTSTQRGLHGTAAAIRVLAEDGRAESRVLIPKLIGYAEDRKRVELPEAGSDYPASLKERLERDEANVIKISETLFALKFVDAAVCDTEALKKQLAEALLNGRINATGWGYFLDRKAGEPQLLPTAYAVCALADYGYDVRESLKYLLDSLIKKPTNGSARGADISVRVFCLYVLSFIRDSDNRDYTDQLPRIFSSMWRRLEPLLDSDIEQNIEYSRDREHYYVRVPWQLYLLALSAKLAPKRRFASRATQRRLKAIINAVNSPEGFTYPHSGFRVSSRTNAVLYDVFSTIEKQLERIWQALLVPAQAIDLIRTFLSSRWVRFVAAMVAVTVIAISLYSWYMRGGHIGELAPEFLAALFLLLITAGKAR